MERGLPQAGWEMDNGFRQREARRTDEMNVEQVAPLDGYSAALHSRWCALALESQTRMETWMTI
jgi:hypothetical protein